jgi:NitT/TauT family transport system substrate-binding protein
MGLHGGIKAREIKQLISLVRAIEKTQIPGDTMKRFTSANSSFNSSRRRLLRGALFASLLVFGTGLLSATGTAHAADKSKFRIAWSIYAGWMPWDYAYQKGIVKKWADKYGIEIEFVQINDYIESINQYTAGQFDGCTMTNMDALTIPAAGGVDSTALIVGDYSNGNDAIVLKNKKSLADIKGQNVNLVELSVSHYFLARALETVGLSEKDIKVVNTSDADIVAAYSTPSVTAVTLWNPQLSEVLKSSDANLVFDSSKTPGEILDMTVVNTATLKKNPELGKALVGAWFETMAVMSATGAAADEAKAFMGKASGTDLAGYNAQLKTTYLFFSPAEATTFTEGSSLIKTMDHVRTFSFEHGILGEGAKSPDHVGMEFPGGKTLGDARNIKLRFDSTYVKLAAENKL